MSVTLCTQSTKRPGFGCARYAKHYTGHYNPQLWKKPTNCFFVINAVSYTKKESRVECKFEIMCTCLVLFFYVFPSYIRPYENTLSDTNITNVYVQLKRLMSYKNYTVEYMLFKGFKCISRLISYFIRYWV